MTESLLTRRWRRTGHGRHLRVPALLATVAAAGLATILSAGAASAQAAPAPPAAGVAPASGFVSNHVVVAYRDVAGRVWLNDLVTERYIPVGGDITGAPAVIPDGTSAAIFGRGTDNQLLMTTCSLSGSCGSWTSVGGDITSKPGALVRGTVAADYSVYARGTDGAVWARDHSASGWGAWHSLGGKVLAGTGPSAAYLGGSYVLATGTNHELYIAEAGVSGFSPAGGLTNDSPALTALPAVAGAPAALAGFATGTNNAGYYHRFLSSSPGWHSMGGQLTSGLGASTQNTPAAGYTFTFGLGTNNQIYNDVGTWAPYPPSFNGWSLLSN